MLIIAVGRRRWYLVSTIELAILTYRVMLEKLWPVLSCLTVAIPYSFWCFHLITQSESAISLFSYKQGLVPSCVRYKDMIQENKYILFNTSIHCHIMSFDSSTTKSDQDILHAKFCQPLSQSFIPHILPFYVGLFFYFIPYLPWEIFR